jgi:hypothetical protein
MSDRPTGFHGLAHEIVSCAVAERTEIEEVARALEGVFQRLEEVMSTMVGEVGFRALMVRALHLTRRCAQAETGLPAELVACFPEQGWVPAVKHAGAPDAEALAKLLLAIVLDLLASFIGDDLTLRLVRRAWRELETRGSGSGPGRGPQS